MKKKYFTEEERKEGYKKSQNKWNEKRKSTPFLRARYLVDNYNQNDKKYNRGKGDLTAEWIVENIFSKPCKHCGKTGWEKIGCNRLDNSKPHTKDNVEPCCGECNVELYNPKKPIAKINPTTNEIVEIYESCMAARRDGYTHADSVAKGKRKQEKGYTFIYL